VELKAVRELAPEHAAQVLNYLKATGIRLQPFTPRERVMGQVGGRGENGWRR
jgi:hypothetical protein